MAIVSLLAIPTTRVCSADVSLGGFGSYLDTEDVGEGYGGGLRLKYDLMEYVGMDLRALKRRMKDSCSDS